FSSFKYIPRLALSPSEMGAYYELPDSDKSRLLPYVPLRGWVASKELKNLFDKIKEFSGGRKIILDVDYDYIYENKDYLITGEFPREVFRQLDELLNPDAGYENWCSLVAEHEWIVPVLQIRDLSNVLAQYEVLAGFGRGVVIRFSLADVESRSYVEVLDRLLPMIKEDERILLFFDFGRISSKVVDNHEVIERYLLDAKNIASKAYFSVSGSSFPDQFGGREAGSNTIHERRLFSKLSVTFGNHIIYSDYASSRFKESGGGGIPIPRIDYPTKNDWFFKRERYAESEAVIVDNKKKKYIEAAKYVVSQDYWVSDLNIWGERMIMMTSAGEEFAIYNPAKATSVRVNIHLYNQIHFTDDLSGRDTDDDWED